MLLRAPVPHDLEAVHAVLGERDLADLGVAASKLEDLRDQWRSPEFELSSDARVAVDDADAVCAWAEVRREGALVAVAPAAEGRGIGAALLGWVEGRERELGHATHRQLIGAANTTAAGLLRAADYTLARSIHIMRRSLGEPMTPGSAPPGVHFRAVSVEADAPLLHALDGAAFAGQPGFGRDSLEVFTAENLRLHDFDAGLSLVAETGSGMAGFLLARRRQPERVGHVEVLAVHPDEHRRGIGSGLLLAALSAFAACGLTAAELMVSSANPAALRLYERHGFRRLHTFDIYEKGGAASAAQIASGAAVTSS